MVKGVWKNKTKFVSKDLTRFDGRLVMKGKEKGSVRDGLKFSAEINGRTRKP